MRTLHSLLDVNNDGVISFDDFQLLAKNFAALGHLTPEAQQEFNDVLKRTWETQWGEISPYNLINAEQYLAEMHHAVNDKELREKIHTFLPFLFKVSPKPVVRCARRLFQIMTFSHFFNFPIFTGRRQRSFRIYFIERVQTIFRVLGIDTGRCGRIIRSC